MHAKYGPQAPSRTYLPAKTVFVHNTRISVCCAQTRVGVANLFYWEFGAHILRVNYIFIIQTGAISVLGVGHQNNWCQANFRVSGATPNLAICFPGRRKSAWHQIFWCPSPKVDMAKLCTNKFWPAPQIWGANSKKRAQNSQNSGLALKLF